MTEKLNLASLDIAEQRRAELKALFPGVFTETENEKGELVESIDFEKLKAELGTFSDVFESRRERYGMDWPGKKDCMKLIQQPSVATLKPCREESVNFNETENLFIEGDNLEALRLLQKSYYGKVKMIYIDPPYNTGKEFIYPDKFSESLETYRAYAGLIDAEGRNFSSSSSAEGRYHTRWLNMLYPRLYLARNLLREDGVIFISIDDNEVMALRQLCNEIFGDDNFLGTVVWKNATDNNPSNIAVEHEYLHVYARSKDGVEAVWKSNVSDVKTKLIEVGQQFIDEYKDADDRQSAYTQWFRSNRAQLWPLDRYKYIDEGGVYIGSQSVHNPGKEGYRYDVIHPETKKPCKQPLMGYRFPDETMQRLLAEDKILFGENEDKIIELKVYAAEFQDKLSGVIELDGRLGAYDLNQLFPEMKRPFTNPKPVRLLTHFLPFLLRDDGDIALDFFAGSCTTADAVLQLNKADGIQRRFIVVQLPEPTDEKTETHKAGFVTISEFGKERIRRVLERIKLEREAEDKETDGKLPGFKEEQRLLDLGFRVFKLDKSNFSLWGANGTNDSEEKIAKQLELHIDHIDPDAEQEEILYELLLKAGFQPTERVEQLELAGANVFSVADGSLLICLEDEVTRELIDTVAEAEPMQFICLDKAFKGNDQLKANAVQTFAARNQGRDKAEQIIFRTV